MKKLPHPGGGGGELVPGYGKRLFGARRKGLDCVKKEFVPIHQESVGSPVVACWAFAALSRC